jgi:alanyl-tRNA synthetase
LRTVLGEHVKQAGSLVAPDRLRFDFSHFGPLSEEELDRVEDLVNRKARENWDVGSEEMPMEAARHKGAIAFFGEKYGDVVRVVTVAPESVELCGGTHVRRSGDIGFFRVTREEGIAAGVRRIEAVTGAGAHLYVRKLAQTLTRAGEMLRAGPFEVVERLERMLADQKRLEKEIDTLRKRVATAKSQDVMDLVQELGGVRVLAYRAETGDPKALRDFGDKLRDRLKSGVIVVGGVDGDKVSLVSMVTPDLTGRFHAGKIVGEVAKLVGGRGGGKPDMAQGGGSQPGDLEAALGRVPEILGLI